MTILQALVKEIKALRKEVAASKIPATVVSPAMTVTARKPYVAPAPVVAPKVVKPAIIREDNTLEGWFVNRVGKNVKVAKIATKQGTPYHDVMIHISSVLVNKDGEYRVFDGKRKSCWMLSLMTAPIYTEVKATSEHAAGWKKAIEKIG